MRFFVFTVLVVLALATGAGAASPQPTAHNGTATPNATTTTTPTASTTTAPTATPTSSSPSSNSATSTPTPEPTPTGTPRPTADDVLDDVDPENATLDDVETVAGWLRSEGADRGGQQADRAREWLQEATADRNVSVPNISLASNATATATPTTTEPPEPDPEGNATRIDGATEIVASEYIESEGVARVTVRSKAVQTITFSDGGFLADGGGEGYSRSEAFGSGETATVQIPVTEVNGRVAVVLSTDETPLYGHIIKPGGGGLDVIDALGSLQALLTGVGVAFVWMLIAGWNELRGERGRPEVA